MLLLLTHICYPFPFSSIKVSCNVDFLLLPVLLICVMKFFFSMYRVILFSVVYYEESLSFCAIVLSCVFILRFHLFLRLSVLLFRILPEIFFIFPKTLYVPTFHVIFLLPWSTLATFIACPFVRFSFLSYIVLHFSNISLIPFRRYFFQLLFFYLTLTACPLFLSSWVVVHSFLCFSHLVFAKLLFMFIFLYFTCLVLL